MVLFLLLLLSYINRQVSLFRLLTISNFDAMTSFTEGSQHYLYGFYNKHVSVFTLCFYLGLRRSLTITAESLRAWALAGSAQTDEDVWLREGVYKGGHL